jgi:hypothetical protein
MPLRFDILRNQRIKRGHTTRASDPGATSRNCGGKDSGALGLRGSRRGGAMSGAEGCASCSAISGIGMP